MLTNIAAIHALTAWRLYNRGAVVEHGIEELSQLGIGKTAVDDLGATACSGPWVRSPTSSCT
ncbi:MAG TPA: hypothetical protein VKZ58_10605 [Longimicrobiales bacterium]|nr:hypothetical protein [Longimicrobiales bacterium]